MKLSAPIFRLKKQARALSRAENIPLHEALNRIAKHEGFESWSLLSARMRPGLTASRLLDQFSPGDLILLAARPNQGKTVLGLSLIAEAARQDIPCTFFSLYLTEKDTRHHLRELDVNHAISGGLVTIDTSDEISAPYIIEQTEHGPSGTLIVIDYLQILDQRRDTPMLDDQLKMLKAFGKKSGAIIVLLSQVNRRYDLTSKRLPDLSDIHLPNPVDLEIFSKTCFLNKGAIELNDAA